MDDANESPSDDTVEADEATGTPGADAAADAGDAAGTTHTTHATDTAAPASQVYTAARGAGVHAFDLAGQERVVRGRMPALEAVNDRMGRALVGAVASWLERDVQLADARLTLVRYGSFVDSLTVPTSIDIAALEGLRGTAMVVCEPGFVFMAIDALFGGNGKQAATLEGREFSATELRVIDRAVALTCQAFAQAWQDVHPVTLAPQRRDTQPQRAAIARGPDTVVHSRFEFVLGERRAALHVCLPFAALEPIRDALYASAVGDEAAVQDPRWMQQLARQIQNAEVVLSAQLAKARATVGELLALEPGDFIELELTPRVQAGVDGVPVFEGAYGIANGRYALRVDRLLVGSQVQE